MMQALLFRAASRALTPAAAVFAVHLAAHGGVGAGMQAGLVVAAALSVHALAFGLEETRRAAPPAALRAASVVGVVALLASDFFHAPLQDIFVSAALMLAVGGAASLVVLAQPPSRDGNF